MVRRLGRSADEYTDDEIRDMTLELMQGLVEAHLAAKGQQEPDRIRAYCPPEARYDYTGPQPVEAAS